MYKFLFTYVDRMLQREEKVEVIASGMLAAEIKAIAKLKEIDGGDYPGRFEFKSAFVTKRYKKKGGK